MKLIYPPFIFTPGPPAPSVSRIKIAKCEDLGEYNSPPKFQPNGFFKADKIWQFLWRLISFYSKPPKICISEDGDYKKFLQNCPQPKNKLGKC